MRTSLLESSEYAVILYAFACGDYKTSPPHSRTMEGRIVCFVCGFRLVLKEGKERFHPSHLYPCVPSREACKKMSEEWWCPNEQIWVFS